MKDNDKEEIIKDDSLDNGAVDSDVTREESHPVSATRPLKDTVDEGVMFLGIFPIPGNDVKSVRVVMGVGSMIAVLAAVGLGISYAAGLKQVVDVGLVTSDCAPCASMGSDILKIGGSAVDATITTVLCNGLINLHSSGIGGGGFMMIRDHKHNRSLALDFRPSAPMAASPEKYSNDEQLRFGPMSVAVPGEVAGLAFAHQYYGRLPWKDLVSPIAELARKGFHLTEDASYWVDHNSGNKPLIQHTDGELYSLLLDPKTKQAKPAGTLIKRPRYADALDLIAKDPNNFYKSDISGDIVNAVGGNITLDDLSSYRARVASVLKVHYHDYVVETVGPPAGGAILLHMLKILEGYNFTANDSNSDLMYHRMVEAMKFGFAVFPDNVDFNHTELRTNFTDSILGDGHCKAIRERITDDTTHNASYYDSHYDSAPTRGTSAITVIDKDEVFVSSISSLNYLYGSNLMTDKYGIILNNDMADFDSNLSQPAQGSLKTNPANEVRGGRRPRSAMSPSVFYANKTKCGKRGAVGGVGGHKIISATLQYILDVLSFNLNSTTSLARPRLHHGLIPNKLLVEESFPVETKNSLKARHHEISTLHREKYLAVISAGYKEGKELFGHGDIRKGGKTSIVEV